MPSPYYREQPGGETIFTVDPRPIKFGPGAALELGSDARALAMTHAVVFTDARVATLERTVRAIQTVRDAGVAVTVYDRVAVEPTDESFGDAIAFLRDAGAGIDGVISIGGGSVIDTAKAANLYASHPAELLAYVNQPIGQGVAVPGPVMPHIACPTTAGTGSEATGVAVFDLLSRHVKTGISSKYLKPTLGLIDPEFTFTLPPLPTAAAAFDVLTHAIESYTAIPYTRRARAADPRQRPPYQGANPFSDSGALEAIRLGGAYLLRAVDDPDDREARVAMMYAATLAGSSFGNAGVHIPHAMSYSVAGMIRDYQPEGWPTEQPLCPHGISVVVNAPAAFRFTAPAAPERHLEVARILGADTAGASPDDAGEILASAMIDRMREARIPNGLSALGYTPDDIPGLVKGAHAQQRLLRQSPLPVAERELEALYRDAMAYW